MNKKFYGALLMGALVMGGAFVSCSDYDDDIKDLQEQINNLNSGSTTSINDVKNQLSAVQSAASAAQAAADKAKAAADAAQGDATAAIEAAKAAVKAEALEAIQAELEKMAKADDVDQMMTLLMEGKIAAIDDNLNLLGDNVKENASDIKTLAEQIATLSALLSDEENQVGVLERLTNMELVMGNMQEKLDMIDVLNASINELSDMLEMAEISFGKMSDKIEEISGLLSEAQANQTKMDKKLENLSTLTVLVDRKLKSIVFQPEFYVDGIEAAEYTYLKYAALTANTDLYVGDKLNDKGNKVELMATPFSAKYTVTQYYHSGDITDPVTPNCNEIPSATNNKYVGKMTAAGVKDSVVYAINPSNAEISAKDVKLYAKNILAMTRADEAAQLNVENAYVKNGYLTVVYTVSDPTKIITANNKEDKSLVNGKKNTTIFELEVATKDTVINSDWAAMYETEIQPVAIAWNAAGAAKAKTAAAYCNTTGLQKELFKNPYEALKQPYSLGIQYDDPNGFNLKELIELHAIYMDLEQTDRGNAAEKTAHKALTLKDAEEKYGLTVSFAPVSYTTVSDGNKTQPSNYINPDLGANGHIVAGTVDPKSSVEDGPFNPKQGVSSVTKQPLVQVLVKKGNDVVLEGYIKLQITRDNDNKVTDWINLENKKDYNCAGLTYRMTWSQASTIILQNTMNMSKAEFDLNYKLLVNNESTDKCAVLFSEANDSKKIDVKNTYAIITEVPDPMGTTNTVLQVALDKYAQQYIIEDLGGVAEFIVKYIPVHLDTDKYAAEPGVFVRLRLEIKETPVLLTMKTKIREYWYKNGIGVNDASDYEKTTSDLNALRLNVNYPADYKDSYKTDAPQYEDGTTETEGFIRDIRNAFEVSGANNDVVLVNGATAHGDTRVKKNTMFYFHPAINGTTFKGDDGKTYKLSVDNDFVICNKWIMGDGPEATFVTPTHSHRTSTAKLSHKIEKIGEKPLNYIETIAQTNKLDKAQGIFTNKTLYVSINGAARVAVATLKQTTGEVYYNHSVEAQQLLNATSYKAAKAKAYVGVYSWNACQDVLAVKDGVFPAYFLRPLDLSQPKEKLVTDASANGSIAKLADIATFVDWRNENITPAKNGWLLAYYGVNKITIDLSKITTNMNGYDINSKLLPAVTTKAKFSLVNDANAVLADMDDTTPETTIYTKSFSLSAYDYAAAPSATVFAAALGDLNLKYVNNGLNVYDWSVKVPVTIGYDWGEFNTYVIVKVVKTLGTE